MHKQNPPRKDPTQKLPSTIFKLSPLKRYPPPTQKHKERNNKNKNPQKQTIVKVMKPVHKKRKRPFGKRKPRPQEEISRKGSTTPRTTARQTIKATPTQAEAPKKTPYPAKWKSAILHILKSRTPQKKKKRKRRIPCKFAICCTKKYYPLFLQTIRKKNKKPRG